ncbi:MAG: FG-GAP-like repeat-containing protein [Bacteroidota bacterium]
MKTFITLSIFLISGISLAAQGTFANPVEIYSGRSDTESRYFFQLGDLNGDGLIDLSTSVFGLASGGTVNVHLNDNSSPFFSETPNELSGEEPSSFYYFGLADLDGDQVDDFLADNGYYTAENASLNYQFVPYQTEENDLNYVTSGDLNDDGYVDIIMTNTSAVYAAINDQSGSFDELRLLSDGGSSLLDFEVPLPGIADFNGDDLQDILIYPSFFNDSVSLSLQQEDGSFIETSLPVTQADILGIFPPAQVYTLFGSDYNNDGHIDVIYENEVGVYALLNEGDGVFNTVTTLHTKDSASGLDIFADFNLDGQVDQLRRLPSQNKIRLFLLDENQNVTTTENVVNDSGFQPKAVDFDQDGDLDVIVEIFDTESGWRLFLCENLTINNPTSSVEVGPSFELNIYPNPIINKLQIDIIDERFTKGNIELYNIAGHLLASYPLINGQNDIQLSEQFPRGSVLYRLSDDKGIIWANGKLLKH